MTYNQNYEEHAKAIFKAAICDIQFSLINWQRKTHKRMSWGGPFEYPNAV